MVLRSEAAGQGLPPKLAGLRAEEVCARVEAGQTNAASAVRTKTLGEIWIENVFSVFNAIIALVIGFFLYFYLKFDDARLLLDCVGVGLVAVFNTAVAVVQETKAKRALDKVRLLMARTVTVVRDLRTLEIPPEEIVLGDVVRLARGDQAVVDGRVLVSRRLEMDESLLTGESVPILKSEGADILSGSYCVAGSGYFEATAVGAEVFAARIAAVAKRYKFEPTPLTRRINTLVQGLFVTAMALIGLSLWQGGGASLDPDAVRRLGAILIALVPQGLVLMSSVTFALGVYRISKVGAVVQRLGAIESFAAATVICMDKTGTITENRLSVQVVEPLAEGMDRERAQAMLGTFASLLSERNATADALAALPGDPGAVFADEVPFSSERKMSAVAFDQAGERRFWALGGFDLLLDRLDPAGRERARAAFVDSGAALLRAVMLVELASATDFEAAQAGREFKARPLCLAGIGDTVRGDAGRVIRDFEAMGKRFKILSGDAAPAVMAVCRAIGWEAAEAEAVSGPQLDGMDAQTFDRTCREAKIFARLSPEHKLRIVRALKESGEHTAMLGDGVNDLPAIKEANLGMAMEEGSQATKEVADIVLLANRFTLLPEILGEGNKIVNSVTAVAKLFLTKNFMVVASTLLTLGLALDFPLTPRRVSLLNIFAIGLPAMLVALRNTNTRVAGRFLVEAPSFAAISALVMTAAAQAAFLLTRALGDGPGSGQAEMAMLAAMVFLSAANFVLVALENHSERLKGEIGYAIAIVGIFAAVCLWPGDGVVIRIARLFYEIAPMDAGGWTGAAVAGIGGVVVLAGLQRWRRMVVAKAQQDASGGQRG